MSYAHGNLGPIHPTGVGNSNYDEYRVKSIRPENYSHEYNAVHDPGAAKPCMMDMLSKIHDILVESNHIAHDIRIKIHGPYPESCNLREEKSMASLETKVEDIHDQAQQLMEKLRVAISRL